MAINESAHETGEREHEDHRQHYRGDHDRQLVHHPDGSDYRIERKHNVEDEDLGDNATERRATPRVRLMIVAFEPTVHLVCALRDEEQAAGNQNEISARNATAEDGEQWRRQPHDPADRQQEQKSRDECEGQSNDTSSLALSSRKLAGENRDENDVVDAKDDLQQEKRAERKPIGG